MPTARLGETLKNQTLILANQDVIHSKSMVVDCSIRVTEPREVGIFCSTFSNSRIEVVKTCSKDWTGCYFDSCTFKGKYYNCRFGMDSQQCDLQAGLRNCDFTNASLNLCSFFNCTPNDLRLPGWPHVTIFYPSKNAADFTDLKSDPWLARLQYSMENAGDIIALTYHIPTYIRQTRPHLLKRWKINKLFAESRSEPPPPEPVFSLENMKKLLQTKPYVHL
ncbi:MAG: hypothetical protein K8T89_06300 [Planctomycetes bacterium]|nr:hypothetical protein [Planctomycetota bacterium]